MLASPCQGAMHPSGFWPIVCCCDTESPQAPWISGRCIFPWEIRVLPILTLEWDRPPVIKSTAPRTWCQEFNFPHLNWQPHPSCLHVVSLKTAQMSSWTWAGEEAVCGCFGYNGMVCSPPRGSANCTSDLKHMWRSPTHFSFCIEMIRAFLQ